MQMDAVIASVLPFVGRDGRYDRDDDDTSDLRPRSSRPYDRDYRPDLEGKPLQTLGEIYTRLTLQEDTGIVTDRPNFDTTKRRSFSPTKRTVEVRVSYLRISKVDTKKQRFHADVFVQVKWEEPRLDGKSAKDLDDFVIDGYWNPEVYIHNLEGNPDRQEVWCDAIPGDPHPFVIWKMRIKGVFRERLELEDFPFDVQELQVKVASRLTQDQVNIIPDKSRLSTVNKHNMVDQSEWVLYDHVRAEKHVIRSKLPTAKNHHPCAAFMCSARRNPTFYFVNIFFMMFLVSSLVFCTVGIPASNYEERLKINIVLLLSVVAMKYVSTNFYPVDLAYLTYMDIYNLLCVFMVAAMAVQNAVLKLFVHDADLLTDVDQGSIYLIIVVFSLVQLVSLLVSIVVVLRYKYDMRSKDKEYYARQQEMNHRANHKRTMRNGEPKTESEIPMRKMRREEARDQEEEEEKKESPRRVRRTRPRQEPSRRYDSSDEEDRSARRMNRASRDRIV